MLGRYMPGRRLLRFMGLLVAAAFVLPALQGNQPTSGGTPDAARPQESVDPAGCNPASHADQAPGVGP